MSIPFLSPREEREEKMTSLCREVSYTEKQLLSSLAAHGRQQDAEILSALRYAKSLDFSKSPLKSGYLSHPMRVALFLLRIEPSVSAEHLVTALLHNVPEASTVTTEELGRLFGAQVARGIRTLLVDRQAAFASIKEDYYRKIQDAGRTLLLIKLLDKMDNLFVLCLNPDESVRRGYIDEVREMLLPFASAYEPELGRYLSALLEDAERIGFSKELKDRLQAYQQHEKMEVKP